MKRSRMITLKAALLASLAAPIFILPAYGQQDVNPSWYNPWPDAPKTGAKAEPAKMAEHTNAQHNNAKVTHKVHTSATQAKKKTAEEPVRAAEALPPATK